MRMVLSVVLGYLLGSISTGVLLSKLIRHDDVRDHGSGNAGMTNMLRVYGPGMAILTLAGDMLKGALAAMIGIALTGSKTGGMLGAVGAMLGNSFPCFFGFKGGKGIGTGFGCLLVLFPLQTLFTFGVFLLVVLLTRYVSAGSIVAAIVLPLSVILTTPYDPILWGSMVFLGVFVIARHYKNIVRLFKGEESRIDLSKFRKKKE